MDAVTAILSFLERHFDALVALVGLLLAMLGVNSKWGEGDRARKVREAAEWVYYRVKAISRKTEMPYDDILETALGLFLKYMDALGVRATDADKETAKAVWTSLHERETANGHDDATMRRNGNGGSPDPRPRTPKSPPLPAPSTSSHEPSGGEPPENHV